MDEVLMAHASEQTNGAAEVSTVNVERVRDCERGLGFMVSQKDADHGIEDIAVGDRVGT